jgi:hypothetical protein
VKSSPSPSPAASGKPAPKQDLIAGLQLALEQDELRVAFYFVFIRFYPWLNVLEL